MQVNRAGRRHLSLRNRVGKSHLPLFAARLVRRLSGIFPLHGPAQNKERGCLSSKFLCAPLRIKKQPLQQELSFLIRDDNIANSK